MTEKSKIRVTVDLTQELYDRLERLTELTGAGSKADTVRDALRVLEFLADRHQQGFEILQRKGDRTEVVPLFKVL